MAKKKAPVRGGAREGSGRPVQSEDGKTVTISATIPEGILESVDNYCKTHGITRSAATVQAYRMLTQGQKEGRPVVKLNLTIGGVTVTRTLDVPESWGTMNEKQKSEWINSQKGDFVQESVSVNHKIERP